MGRNNRSGGAQRRGDWSVDGLSCETKWKRGAMGEPTMTFIGLRREESGREMPGHQRRGVEINSVHYEAEKKGGESTGCPVDEGKWRRHEAARLHVLRRVARGHGTEAATLLGARGG
jgi:hypothetical protein